MGDMRRAESWETAYHHARADLRELLAGLRETMLRYAEDFGAIAALLGKPPHPGKDGTFLASTLKSSDPDYPQEAIAAWFRGYGMQAHRMAPGWRPRDI